MQACEVLVAYVLHVALSVQAPARANFKPTALPALSGWLDAAEFPCFSSLGSFSCPTCSV